MTARSVDRDLKRFEKTGLSPNFGDSPVYFFISLILIAKAPERAFFVYSPPCCCLRILAQVSRRVTVRLKTSLPLRESGSRQK